MINFWETIFRSIPAQVLKRGRLILAGCAFFPFTIQPDPCAPDGDS
jgi:hypothetical protein